MSMNKEKVLPIPYPVIWRHKNVKRQADFPAGNEIAKCTVKDEAEEL